MKAATDTASSPTSEPAYDRGPWWWALADAVVRFRWLFVVPVLLPLSMLFRIGWAVRGWYYQRWRSAPQEHDGRVAAVQDAVRRATEAPDGVPLYTSRKAWQSVSTREMAYKRSKRGIRLDLHDILDIDTARCIVRVEPRVTVGQLTGRLLRIGWTLPVVPELDDLTIGGLVLGYGIEVSSHRYGLFNDIVEACEVVTANGRVIRASREEHVDLFRALRWSYGALGFVVAVELRIMPAKPYVHLTYHPVRGGLADLCELLRAKACAPNPPEFVEGILFRPDAGVIMTGGLAEHADPARINAIGWWFKPWFYSHCRAMMEQEGGDEYIPLRDYYRRHERGIYWESELIIPFGNNPAFRYLLGWMMPPKIAFLRLTESRILREYYFHRHVIQDALVPMEHLQETLAFFHNVFECYPIWLCPFRNYRAEPQGIMRPSPSADDHEMFCDVLLSQTPGPVLRGEPYDPVAALRAMERFLIEHRGYQALYAVTCLSRDDYREMFDCTLYDRVRSEYGAEGVFMDTYAKVRRSIGTGNRRGGVVASRWRRRSDPRTPQRSH